MAKTPKFSEEKLLEAVVQYADLHRGKIEATKLALWASENVEGLECVESWHFTRPGQKKDPKTGKVIKYTKLCTAKISELNAARSTIAQMNTNILLKSASVDKFLTLPPHEQRKLILDTRAQVDKLIAENASLRAENRAVSAHSQALSVQAEDLSQRLECLETDHPKLLSLLERAMEKFDADERRAMLESIGVHDGYFDLNVYADSLKMRLDEAESVNALIRKTRIPSPGLDINDLIGGVDFG